MMVNGELSIEIVKDFNGDTVREIMKLEQLFPSKTRYDENTVGEYLKNEGWIHMFLKRDGKVIGYILSLPNDYVVDELKDEDPLMKIDPNRYYIDQIAMIPEERKGYAFLQLVYELLDELDRRGINRISSHILATNGLSKLILRVFGSMITKTRDVTMPRYGDEKFIYIEAVYVKKD